ncbi:MAG: ABC transporter permease subunit [Phycisphaerae bacterium]|jgi:Cu-processing system permease protein
MSHVAECLRSLLVLAKKEIRDALRNRWFLLYAVCFAALSLGLASVAMAGTGRTGLAGFGRTAATLINLVLLIVPLMALTIGAGAIAGERERGTLEALLSQPLTRHEVLLGKYLGLALSLLAALALGFGTTAVVLAFRGASTNSGQFAAIFVRSVLLAWAMLSVGFLVSAVCRRTSVALGVAIFLWLTLVFLGDLGLMGTALTLQLTPGELLGAALANPLQVFKVSAVSGLHRSLDLLGPAGLFASRTFGDRLPLLLDGLLAAWIVLPLLAAGLVFSRRSPR